MESSAKTSSSDHDAFISAAHLLPKSTATHWNIHLTHSAARPMFCPHTTSFTFNLNNEDDEEYIIDATQNNDAETIQLRAESGEISKLPLFEKPLTPSDVGKLNRLVIPKQHAENYFPLNGGADSGENGMLLSFEDEVGKSWRFRYSYWNSSQSYVLTKGWSRFVKEKRLDAGDIVIFARHSADAGRLFIGWRRRNSSGGEDSTNLTQPTAAANGGGWNRAAFYSGNPYRSQHQMQPSLPHQQDFSLHAAGSAALQSQTATNSVSGNSKRLRLFGVNLECEPEPEPEPEPESSQAQQHHSYHEYYYSNPMDTTFSGAAEDAYRHQG